MTAFVGLLAPVLAVAVVVLVLSSWAATRWVAGGGVGAAETRRGAAHPAPRWSIVPLVVPLVFALVAARATSWWVFSLHAAGADASPLLFALSSALVWLCGGLGFVLVVTSLSSMRAATRGADRDHRGSR